MNNPTTGEQDIIERLRYIADSPPSDHGGFHEQAIQTAKDALAALAAERQKYERSQEKVKEYFDLLAAERERFKHEAIGHANERQRIREQLAAAVEALHELLCDSRKREKAEGVLAKIGGKP